MNTTATDKAIAQVTRQRAEQQERTRQTYIRAAAKLADDIELPKDEREAFAAAMQNVILNPYDPHRVGVTNDQLLEHVKGLKTLRKRERDLAQFKAGVDLPTAFELRQQIEELDAEIGPKIAAMLKPKRDIERQIDRRRDIDQHIAALEHGVMAAHNALPFKPPAQEK